MFVQPLDNKPSLNNSPQNGEQLSKSISNNRPSHAPRLGEYDDRRKKLDEERKKEYNERVQQKPAQRVSLCCFQLLLISYISVSVYFIANEKSKPRSMTLSANDCYVNLLTFVRLLCGLHNTCLRYSAKYIL